MEPQNDKPKKTKQEILNLNIISKQQFAMAIEALVQKMDMSYIEAIIHYCDTKALDPVDVSKLCVGSLKAKLEAEAQRNNLLPKTSSLF
jgi:hypothetical protein